MIKSNYFLLFALAMNFSFSTIKRLWTPSHIFPDSSKASTLKLRDLPSILSSSAIALTFIPTGLAERCLMFSSVPTVDQPGGRKLSTAERAQPSIRAIMAGVA